MKKDPIGEQTLDVMSNAPFYNKWVFSFFRPFLKGKILEAGAGTGTFSGYFSKYGDFTAIDFNKSYVNLLKKKYNAGFGDIQKGEFFFKSKKFDTIVTLNVVEHIKDDKAALKNLYNLLNPGGKLLILVPAHMQAFSKIDEGLGHYRRYTINDLAKKLINAGFEIKQKRYLNILGLFGWFVSGKVLRKSQLETSQVCLFDFVSKPFLFFEKIFKLPFGISVFVVAQKPSSKTQIKKVSIIVPVYNEERTLGKLLIKVLNAKLPGKISKEIIVIDDGSIDQSAQIAKKFKNIKLIKHKINSGKGTAIKTGLENAKGDVVIIQDADLEYNPDDYSKLLKPILENKTNVVYGSRLRKLKLIFFGENKTLHPQNYFANKFLSSLTNLLFKTSLTDMETCYKVFRRELINPKALNSKQFEIEPELTTLFAKQKENILEIDIKVKPRDYSQGKKIKPKDGIIAIQTLFVEKFIR